MANEGATKPTYSELEIQRLIHIEHAGGWNVWTRLIEQERDDYKAELARVRGLLQRYGSHSYDCTWFRWTTPPECSCGFNDAKAVPLGAESADIGKLDSADKWTPELKLFHKLWGKAVGTSDYVKSDWQKLEHELFIKPKQAGSAETGGEKARHQNWLNARDRGEHPETLCMRCGEKNVHAWFTQSEIWNQVMRETGYEEKWGIVCPQCFSELAAEKFGDHCLWELKLDLPTFRQSSSPTEPKAESVPPEKLNTVHKSGAESSLSSPPQFLDIELEIMAGALADHHWKRGSEPWKTFRDEIKLRLAASPELLPTQLPIAKHPLTPEPQSTQRDTTTEKI